ncbi:coiled-coil domain-containing protein 18 isoform X1 [Mugil cephalus]|uniref:coiled-coil domain-containing protein 18 isoform X1 n=2 Tax=Mugil cephalus TaxID=48193 RepID=UPI001FB742C4|nr:coiled-coil domain-containing protein 18 isoform X1 [Mugil cephalus]
MFEDEEELTNDLVSLRNLLRLTELSLQSVGQKLSHSECHQDESCLQQSPDHLILQDGEASDVPLSSSVCVCLERPLSAAADRRAAAGSPLSSSSMSASFKAQSVEMESISSRKKGGCVRQENACLVFQDEQLISDLDAMQYELATSKSQVRHRGPKFGVNNNVAVMSEQIRQLEAELEAQAKDLKEAELRADCCQEAAAHSDIVVASLTEELNSLREEFNNKTALGKRAEQQRNQALQNAEKLKEAFKDYKATISIKLKRVMESESRLKESLIECDREKEELEMKFNVLEREKAEHSKTISQLKEEVRHAKATAAGLQTKFEEAERRTSHLERQLVEQSAECREVASVRKELEDLRTQTHSQEQRATQSLREAQQSQAELSSLEAILALLHLREGAVGPVCVSPCMLPPVDYSGTAHLLKLKPGEGYQQLLRVLQAKEAERMKQSSVIERLQERLRRAQEENSSLQSSMAQRASHYQSLHTELLDKVSQATDTEKELKRKSARVAALEKQLQEKTSSYAQAALKNTELENQLLEKTNTLQHYQSLMTKKQREYQESLEACKQSQSHQYVEQQHRIEMLQLSVEQAQSRVLEMEQELSSLQMERDAAQKAAQLLQTSLNQLTQKKQTEDRHNEELVESFKRQAAQSATKVCELQSSLSACREELSSYLQQMEEMKKNHETELQKKNNKVSSLQEKLHSTSLVCQSSSEQNLQLQFSLQQQQTMLSESTARVSELEESQSQLHTQVSSLEQQLERARTSLQDEVGKREQDVQMKDKKIQEMNQENIQLSESVSHLTSETEKCRGELMSKESDLQNLQRDVSIKTSQISSLEENLQHMKNQLSSKSDMVMDLEEKLHRCEADQRNCVQQVQILEQQLQTVQGELADALKQLRELKEVLQRTQTVSDERQSTVEKLTVQLRETHRELEERTHEVLDMDSALKERQGELQQRAKLLAQLEVAIREHKQEMERKVEFLEQSLEARERELKDAQREHLDRNVKESQELSQQLCVCQQRLQKVSEELEETRRQRETLNRELDDAKLLTKETEARLYSVEEELTLKEARWEQLESRLQGMVTSLEQELDLEREQHSKELDSLQQTRGQLLKVSEQISTTMRSSQEQLTVKLQQSQAQLEQVKAELDRATTELDRTTNQVGQLQTQLDQSQAQFLQIKTQLEQSRIYCEQTKAQNIHLRTQLEQMTVQLNQTRAQAAQLQTQLLASEKSVETSNDSLLIKESELTRLQARISSLGRTADRQNLYNHALSLPALHKFTDAPERHSPASSPKRLQTTATSPSHVQPTHPHSPTHRQTCSSPPAHTYPHLSKSHQACDAWMHSSSTSSSLDLPPSLKATLREALESTSASISSFQDSVNYSWQGLSSTDATATSDVSFDPLTYMVDKQGDRSHNVEETLMHEGGDELLSESRRESVSTLVGQEEQEEEVDMSSLTGMLRFVNQTLAMQEDPSVWSSTQLTHT